MRPLAIHINNSTSLHQMLNTILERTGPASVWLSSFSICDEAICSLKWMKDSGLITDLHCILDYSMRKTRMDLLEFLAKISEELILNHNHTKIILILNEKHSVSLITSANFTENRRWEVGIEHGLPEVAEILLQFMKEAIKDGLPIIDKNETKQ